MARRDVQHSTLLSSLGRAFLVSRTGPFKQTGNTTIRYLSSAEVAVSTSKTVAIRFDSPETEPKTNLSMLEKDGCGMYG